MAYILVNKRTQEVVDTSEQTDKKLAWTFFYLKKKIPDRDDFNKLYEVKRDDRNRPSRL